MFCDVGTEISSRGIDQKLSSDSNSFLQLVLKPSDPCLTSCKTEVLNSHTTKHP